MNPFNSFLSTRLSDFIGYRQAIGFSNDPIYSYLRTFDRYLANRYKDPVALSPSFFLELRADLKSEARSVNRILCTVRMFFGYLVRCGDYAVNPVKDIPPLPENEIIPFIFSASQVDQLLVAICETIRKEKRFFTKDLAVYLALLLIARCGMRISEPLRLLKNHYRQSERTLYIERAKFRKDRLLPVQEAVDVQIQNYLNVRDKLGNHRNPYLLAGSGYRGLNPNRVRHVYGQAVRTIGLDQPRRVLGRMNFNGPTVHSLRHSFAVNTLLKIKSRGGSPQQALPVLAAYMGHSAYKYTAKYLKMIDADQRQDLLDFVLTQRR
jgi:integrase/recombinase XerD